MFKVISPEYTVFIHSQQELEKYLKNERERLSKYDLEPFIRQVEDMDNHTLNTCTDFIEIDVKDAKSGYRDILYRLIMDDASLSKEAVILARNSSPKRAISDLMKFIIEIGLNNQPQIRLSDRGVLFVAARIMQDYAN
jgi:hypothetical protein